MKTGPLPMPYRLTLKAPVVYVSWRGFSVSELREVTGHVAEMRRGTGQPVAYCARIPDGPHVFTEEERLVLTEFLLGILPYCSTVHHVVEGDGFVKSARLAIVSTLARSTPRPRDFHMHATLEEGFRTLKGLYGVDLDDPSRVSEIPAGRASAAFREAGRIAEKVVRTPRKGS